MRMEWLRKMSMSGIEVGDLVEDTKKSFKDFLKRKGKRLQILS